VVVAEADRLFADALSLALAAAGIRVQALVSTPAGVIRAIAARPPALLAVGFPQLDRDVVPLGRRIRVQWPSVRLLAMLDEQSSAAARVLSRAGYCGAVSKDMPPGVVIRAFRAAARGEPIPGSVPVARSGTEADSRFEQLTPRELQVLQSLAEGASSTEIAHRLRIKTNTVRTHVQHVLVKLHVNSRLEAVSLASQPGGPLASTCTPRDSWEISGAG
jgi:DNA-binding NarL/FixJ family response regulator